MKKLLQWLAVAVFAVLVFVPALAQAQTVPVQLTSFQVTNLEKQPVNSVGLHSTTTGRPRKNTPAMSPRS